MADPAVVVPAVVLAAAPLGALADMVLGHFSTTERTTGAMQALADDLSLVTELMASATCAMDEDEIQDAPPAAA
jgi:hypothetical protein